MIVQACIPTQSTREKQSSDAALTVDLKKLSRVGLVKVLAFVKSPAAARAKLLEEVRAELSVEPI